MLELVEVKHRKRIGTMPRHSFKSPKLSYPWGLSRMWYNRPKEIRPDSVCCFSSPPLATASERDKTALFPEVGLRGSAGKGGTGR